MLELDEDCAKKASISGASANQPRLPPIFISNDIYRATGYNRQHPLAIVRIGPVMDICAGLGWLDAANYRESSVASVGQLCVFHDPDYVAALAKVSKTGMVPLAIRERYSLGTIENPVFPGLFERTAISVGGSMLAAQLALDGRVVYHPAGGTHHGRADRASGFCYFNDPVFAILEFLRFGLQRVAYLDLDAHHGDGVEAAFVGEERVTCFSIHEANRWPGTGQHHAGNALNFPVPRGFDDAGFSKIMATEVLPALASFAPEAIVITCGADALAGDPLSSMQLSNVALWDAVMDAVALVPRAVVLGGGGYNPWTTVRCWAGLWGRLNGRQMPSSLPREVQDILRGFSCDLIDSDEINTAWFTSLVDHPEITDNPIGAMT